MFDSLPLRESSLKFSRIIMSNRRGDNNPHFGTPNSQFPREGLAAPEYEDQQNQLQPLTSSSGMSGSSGRQTKKSKHQEKHQRPLGAPGVVTDQGTHRASPPKPPQSLPESQRTDAEMTEQKDRGQGFPSQNPKVGRQRELVPQPKKTKPFAWFLAGFCAIFWVVIILGGLIVLIVYLVFRPRSPQFDVPGVSLNAAYLDMDTMLNADLTVLAKFTNPNKKVKVDFSYVVLDLYYGNTLIASQYVEPFAAMRAESKLANIHMVTSQVRLPVGEIQRLRREISKNAVVFEVKGVFRARSSLGSFLRYSYWLYGHCTVLVTGPPSGVIKASKCKTKR